MEEEIICPHCGEQQVFEGPDSDVFFSEGDHKFQCYWCGEVFEVHTEAVYLYTVEELEE